MKNFLLIVCSLFLLLPFQGYSQNIALDVDVDNLYYDEPGCDDCNGIPDPRWRVRLFVNGTNYDWNNDRDEVCGFANNSNFGIYTTTSVAYNSTTSMQLNGFESDGGVCFGDDNNCGGYATVNSTATVTNTPPCQWSFYSGGRTCDIGYYQVNWSTYWSYLFSPVISAETPTNQVRCKGAAPSALTATISADANGRSLGRWYRWQISNTPTGPWVNITGASGSNTATTLSFTPGQISGTRYYRLQVTSNCSADFGSYTATSAVYTVTYAFDTTSPYTNVSGYTYSTGDAAPAIPSGVCGSTVLPGQVITLPVLLSPNAGAAVNYTSLTWAATGGSPTTGSGTSFTWTAPTTAGNYNVNLTYNYGCSLPATVTCAIAVGSPDCNFAYVSATGSDVSTGGGPNNPYATINYAITQLGTKRHIRVAGTITEPAGTFINIPAGVTIEGGYTVSGGNWTKNNNQVSIINSSGYESISGVCHRIAVKATTSNWSLIDLDIRTTAITNSYDGSNRGCSNYGLWISGASNYNVIRCNITTGAASNGVNGTAGGNGSDGSPGGGGSSGGCSDSNFLSGGGGGAGGGGACTGGAGGAGGSASANGCRNSGNAGGNASCGGTGGAGGNGSGCQGCCSRANGATGIGGNGGSAGAGFAAGDRPAAPATAVNYYTPAGQSASGSNGTAGGGGGGGGSSSGERRTGFLCASCVQNYGNSGGGGGGGGGAGYGGTGGYGGGGSFAVYRTSSSTGANFANVTLSAGTAGTGGTGGAGGSGGSGGAGGAANGGCSGDRATSGGGGNGGNGGAGGRGRDGANGTSAAFVSDGTVTTFTNSAAVTTPVMTIPYNTLAFCQNSQMTLTKASGTWALPSGLTLVNLQNNTTAGQALTDNNIVVSTTNTVSAPTGFNFTSPASVPSFLVQSPTTRALPTITVNGSSTTTICEGGTVTLASSGGTSPINYDWRIFNTDARTPISGLTSSLANPTINVASLSPGTYNIYYSELNQCCGWSTPRYTTFTIVADPVAPTLASSSPAINTDVCIGGSVSATITAGSGGAGCTDDYRVSTDGGSTWAAYTSATAITVPNAAGSSIIVQGRRANGCGNGCDGTAVDYQTLATWSIIADPTSETAVSDPTICFGSSTNITASAIGGNGTISTVNFERASSTSGPWTSVQNTSSATYATPTNLAAGTWYYRSTVTQTVTGCTAAADATPVTLVVIAQPTQRTVTASTPTICTGGSSNIVLTGSDNGVTYTLWNVTDNTFSATQTGDGTSNLTFTTGSLTGTKTFKIVASISPCADVNMNNDVAVTVTVVPSVPSAITASANSLDLCVGSSFDLNATGGTGAASWSWSGPNSYTNTNQDPAAFTTVAASAGNYTVSATNACGTTTSNTLTLALTAAAPSSVTATATPNPICENNTLTLNGSATGATTWLWSGPNSFSSSSQSPSISSITTAGAGLYTLTASNVCGDAGLDDNFSDGNFTASPPWTVQAGGFLSTTFLRGDNTATTDQIVTSNTQAYGSWQFDYTFQTTSGTTAQVIRYFISASSTNLTTTNGYYVYLDGSGAISLRRFTGGTPTTLISSTYSANTSAHTVRVTRTSANVFELFLDGSSLGTATDATYTSTAYAGVWNTGVFASDNHTIDNISCVQYATTQVTVNPSVTTPTAITVADSEPTCQTTGASSTDYNSTATVGTLSWSLTGITNTTGTLLSSAINSTTGVVTWPVGWSGTATINAVSTGCNGPSAAVTRTVTVNPTVTQPAVISLTTGTEPTCQLGSNTTTSYSSSTTYGTLSWSLTNVTTISGTAPTISGSTVTWYAGWSGSADVTVVSTGCNGPSANRTRTITVRPTPTASVSVVGTNPICQSGSSTVRFTGINGTTITYNINGGSNTTANITSGGFVDINTGALSVSSTYDIVNAFYTDNAPACTATPSGSATVNVTTGPIQRTVQVASSTICSGTAGGVQVLNSESGTVYQLYNTTTSANVGATQTGNGSTLTFSTGNLTSYSTFKVIASRNPCTALDMNNGIDVEIYVVSNGYWKGSVSTDWFDSGNWCLGGGIPTNATDVFIPNAATTNYDPNIANTGAVTRSINIESSGVLSIAGNRNLDVWGDWNNSGTFNYNASTITFKGTGNANLTGFTDPQEFNNLRVDKGTNATPLLDIGVNTTVYGSLQPTNGLAKVSGGDLTLSTNATTIASTAAVEVNGGNLVAGSSAFTNNGAFRVVTGNADIASLANNSGSNYNTTGGITTIDGNVTNSGATVSATGGSITANGDWSNASTTTATYNGSTIAVVGNYSSTGSSTVNANSATVSVGGNYTNTSSTLNLGGAIVVIGGSMVNSTGTVNQTGGAITFNTTGGSYNSNAVLQLDGGSNLNISTGTMYFERANGGTGNDVVILSGAGTKAITGGTFQFGNTNTPASQVFKVNNSVVDFNNFTINGNNTPTVQLLANAATRSTGVLTVNGVLDLNQFTFNVKNGSTSAVTGSSYVLSEATSGNSKLAWNIGNNTGSYVFPFGNAAGVAIPFTFNVTTAGTQNGAGNVTVSTYPSGDDNTPWVSGVAHMNFVNGPGTGTDATLDRWWVIDANNYTVKPRSTMTFKYADDDLSGNGSITEGFLKAQRWNANGGPLSSGGWDAPNTFGANTNNAVNNTVTVADVYSYSPWVLHDGESGGNSPLPVELVDFKAACVNDVVTINWTTATEVNNDYFTVQRSTDLSNYTNVAVVEGAGNSNTYRNYTTKDQYPLDGTSYYRLMQTDYDGQFEIFSPVAVMCVTKDADVISVFPNPANDRLNVTMNLTAGDRGRIIIYNHFGQLVESLFVEPKAGFNTYNFDLANLVQGQYLVSFMMEGKVLPSQKVIISR